MQKKKHALITHWREVFIWQQRDLVWIFVDPLNL